MVENHKKKKSVAIIPIPIMMIMIVTIKYNDRIWFIILQSNQCFPNIIILMAVNISSDCSKKKKKGSVVREFQDLIFVLLLVLF